MSPIPRVGHFPASSFVCVKVCDREGYAADAMSVIELTLYDPRVPASDQVSLMVGINMHWDVTQRCAPCSVAGLLATPDTSSRSRLP
jgi:hypothetical protein